MALNFYFKLAYQNILKNKKNYFPYLISNIVVICIFFSFRNLIDNLALYSSIGLITMSTLLGMGVSILALFSLIFMFYTNSFLFKRRKKELGLYNVLGMEKRHLVIMIAFEVGIIAIVSIVFGLLGGMLFYKLAELLLFKILNQPFISGLHYSLPALIYTIELFLVIFGLTFIYSIFQISKVNAVDLMAGAKSGEKEPKTRILMAIIGFVCLIGGYTLAQKTTFTAEAVFTFFPAVLLVIIGTYFTFIAGSIAVLKLLKKNKRFYYQSKHFTVISQMIYRMKQNAVGLANICILSTMVIVTLSTTIALYVGANDLIDQRYPQDINISLHTEGRKIGEDEEGYAIYENYPVDFAKLDASIKDLAKQYQVTLNNVNMYQEYRMAAKFDGTDITLMEDDGKIMEGVYFVPQKYVKDLAKIQNDNEVMVYHKNGKYDDISSLTINGQAYDVISCLPDLDIPGMIAKAPFDEVYIFLKDEAAISQVIGMDYEEAMKMQMGNVYQFDLSEEDEKIFSVPLQEFLQEDESAFYSCFIESKRENRDTVMELYGGLFFIGLFLGSVFMIATILIIYYKQISEGYDDASRYEVMQKVGMSKQEIKKNIRFQVLSVFFLPLLVACCHMLFAFRLIRIILSLLMLTNTTLFMWACIGVILVFAICYCLIFMVTSREYYKIVTPR